MWNFLRLFCGYAAHVENDGQPQKTGLPTFPTIAWKTKRFPHIHKTGGDCFFVLKNIHEFMQGGDPNSTTGLNKSV